MRGACGEVHPPTHTNEALFIPFRTAESAPLFLSARGTMPVQGWRVIMAPASRQHYWESPLLWRHHLCSGDIISALETSPLLWRHHFPSPAQSKVVLQRKRPTWWPVPHRHTHLRSTRGGDTDSSMPSRRMLSIKMLSCSSPRACARGCWATSRSRCSDEEQLRTYEIKILSCSSPRKRRLSGLGFRVKKPLNPKP